MAEAPTIFSGAYYARLRRLEERGAWFRGTRSIAKAAIRRFLGNPAGGLRVLDVGCGTGATLRWLRQFAGSKRVVGMDAAPSALRWARRDGPVACGSASTLPFDDTRFDLIYCADVVQHLSPADRQAALREFARVLRPGGVVIVRANTARGKPDGALAGYEDFDVDRFPEEAGSAQLEVALAGRISLLAGLRVALRKQSAGGGWESQGISVARGRGVAFALAEAATALCLAAEAGWIAGGNALPDRLGASSLFVLRKHVRFERA